MDSPCHRRQAGRVVSLGDMCDQRRLHARAIPGRRDGRIGVGPEGRRTLKGWTATAPANEDLLARHEPPFDRLIGRCTVI